MLFIQQSLTFNIISMLLLTLKKIIFIFNFLNEKKDANNVKENKLLKIISFK